MAETRQERRDGILAAAKALFTRFGYRKTSMDEVARAARVTKPTVYAYFPSKEDLLTEVIRSEVARIFTLGRRCRISLTNPITPDSSFP